ncbi:MAG: ATP-binding protein [Pseudonocardiaceae bacterium]
MSRWVSGPGRALLIRGRRRVGKSRLVEEFVERAEVPYLYFTASAQPTVVADVRLFVEAARSSTLPASAVFEEQAPQTWDAALHLLVAALPTDRATVIILDEMPYLVATDPGFEGTLQKLFDRELSRRPVLLICIGSDLAMMEALNAYGRPFHQRATEMVVPLSPADAQEMLAVPPADAFDAYLVSGGLPLILAEWPAGATVMDYLAGALMDPTSARETRYAVADPYLRFWISFVGPYLPEIERGRGDLTLARVRRSWTSWRGRAIEPVVRESMRRLPGDRLPTGTNVIGGYWTRTNDPEVDIVGADRGPVAKTVTMVGSVKWQERRLFDDHDLARLVLHRSQVPGTAEMTPLVAVSRSGASTAGLLVLGPEELMTAYRSATG